MEGILLIIGILCLVYFCVLLSVGMDFSFVWFAGGIFFLTAGFCKKTGRIHLPHGAVLGMEIVFGAVLLIFLSVECLIFSRMFSKGEAGLDYLVVLGAQVRGTEPSRALRKRLDKAVDYLEENMETKVVVSGGKGNGEDISEAEAMSAYLIEKGIERNRIICEDQSTSTVENLEFTGKLIDRKKKIGLVTNNFHVYRAVKLAQKQGYTSVQGIAAPSDPLFQPHYLVREFLAMIKEWVLHYI